MALLRVQLKPDVPAEVDVDGAWWPRSLNLSLELPVLLASLSPRLGHAVLVSFDEQAWDDSPQHLRIDEQAVLLEGADSKTSDRVTVVGADGDRLILLVVPPDTAAPAAMQSLAKAASPTSHASSAAEDEASHMLDEVAGRLARHEGAKDPGRTAQISRWVRETAESFDDAPIQSFVPILVEHIVRIRMAATARTH